ncbi:unnamed protein product [Meganyctiphanes norvegica]|uniref:Ankyrin repeat domain-containing protein 16 n=1 Tax=Meganyctiphanes norvegica TaxID=48144 RepID=A0AAV2PL54_MEGNR
MDKHLMKEIFNAIQRGDLSSLESHTKGRDVCWPECTQGKLKDTAIHIAVQLDKIELVDWLLSHGCAACLEQQNGDGKRPLHSSVQSCNLLATKMLIDYNVEVNPLKRADWTPLMLACTRQSVPLISILLDHGADPLLVNKDGWSSFHVACREGNVEVLEHLLKVNSKLWNTVSKNGRAPLHTAALHGHEDVVNFLINNCGYPADQQDSCGNTPLMDAMRMGHRNIASLLLFQHNANINARDKMGCSVLNVAAEAGQDDIVNWLVKDLGVHVNTLSNTTGMSALHSAAKEGHVLMLQTLVELGCNLNTKDNRGRNCLWLACGSRHKECVRKLLSLGATDDSDLNGIRPSKLMPFAGLVEQIL